MGILFDTKNDYRSFGLRSPKSAVGTTRRGLAVDASDPSGRMKSQSAVSSGNNMQFGSVGLDIDIDPILEGMDYSTDDKALFDVYRDIYYFDPIGGSYVDMYSTLPYGEFSLGGAKDALLDPFYEVCERLRIGSMMPSITTDRMVTGAHVSSMLYNKQQKKFLDLMCHRYDDINVIPLPFNNQDPILEWTVPEETRTAMNHESDRVKRLREYIGADLCKKIDSGEPIELDTLGTIYLPRRQFSSGKGISCFRRILPVWLIEKNLYRGTLIESGRRQRGILHAQLGDGSEWEASIDEMQYITDLLLSADSDPIGAVIATRMGVTINEFRQGGDFWKITDIWDQTTQYKLRALGASEALLSGDATFANGETGLMAFMENLAASRNDLTRQLFYQKLFPLVAIINGLALTRNGNIVRKNDLGKGDMMDVMSRMQDGSKLFIPTVHWAKRLRPESDMGQMEALRALSELGVPVSLRAIAAAGGYNLDQVMADQDENLAMQRKLLDYKRRVAELNKMAGGDEAEGGGGGGSFSSAEPYSFDFESAVLGGNKRPGLAGRNWDHTAELFDTTVTGKKKHVFRQKIAQDKANEAIYKASRRLSASANNPLASTSAVTRVPCSWERSALSRIK